MFTKQFDSYFKIFFYTLAKPNIKQPLHRSTEVYNKSSWYYDGSNATFIHNNKRNIYKYLLWETDSPRLAALKSHFNSEDKRPFDLRIFKDNGRFNPGKQKYNCIRNEFEIK